MMMILINRIGLILFLVFLVFPYATSDPMVMPPEYIPPPPPIIATPPPMVMPPDPTPTAETPSPTPSESIDYFTPPLPPIIATPPPMVMPPDPTPTVETLVPTPSEVITYFTPPPPPIIATPPPMVMPPDPTPIAATLFPTPTVTHKSKTGLIAGIVSSVCVTFLLVLGLVMYWCYCKKRKTVERNVEGPSALTVICDKAQQDTSPTNFTYKDLKEATNNFAQDNKLGEGGSGSVYKGCLKKMNLFAVKKISSYSTQGSREYTTEVKTISTLRHKSLVKLLGWCHERKQELLLVYEFMPNGSLDSHLFGKKASLLDWGIRMKIAKGLASALHYLHKMCENCVLHRDVKSANIMLDEHFDAKLGDFGLARMVNHLKGSNTSVYLSGTQGYMAPEYINTCIASKETDVYSYGVVALEIATGKRAIHNNEQGPVNLVEWVWSLFGTGKLPEAVDPRLGSDINMSEITLLMTVALWCTHPDMNSRPSMGVVARVLDYEAQLPDLPSRMPTAPGSRYSETTKALLAITEALNPSESSTAVSSSVSSTTGCSR